MRSLTTAAGLFCLGAIICACSSDKPVDGSPNEQKVDGPLSVAGRDGGAVESAGAPQAVTTYDLHGRAGFHKVHIFAQPDMDTPRLGYLRKGQHSMVGDPQYTSESCPGGWFKLPEGGFVCNGRGMLVGDKPRFIPRVPPEARIDEIDPYRHGFVRADWTPLYKRLPKIEEIWQPPTVEVPDAGVPEVVDVADGGGSEKSDGGAPPPEIIPHDEHGADGGVDYHRYTKKNFRNVRSLLPKGFWISIDERVEDEENGLYYYETVKGDYVPSEGIHPVQPSDFKGYEVLGDSPLPAVIVTGKRAVFLREERGRFRNAGPVERRSSYRVYETRKRGRRTFYRVKRDRWLRASDVLFFDLRTPPEGLSDRDKWIRIDLGRQTLEAYEGVTPVYVTLVSSGLPESEETLTPNGRFSIVTKHLTNDMSGTVGDDEAYSVEDVPWVQYIHLNIALHASFWHNSFGRPKSHGCINLAPRDARWLFNWTDPPLPEKWHGVIVQEGTPSTLVIIEGQTPDVKK